MALSGRRRPDPWPVVLSGRLYQAVLRLLCPEVGAAARASMARDFRAICRDAYAHGGTPAVRGLWRLALIEALTSTRDETMWLLTKQGGVRHMDIHHPAVQRASRTTLKRSLQALLTIAIMQLSTVVMESAARSGSLALELLMIAVAMASIVGCVVATARELLALVGLSKALLDSRQ